jgi:hypothetical protein
LDRPPPVPGEHATEVLTECGFDPVEIAELERAGVLGVPVTRPSGEEVAG